MTRVVLFDIDGTLLASGGAGKKAMLAGLAEALGRSVEPEKVPDFSGRTDWSIICGLLELAGESPSRELVAKVARCYLGNLPRTLQDSPGAILPGVEELLESLSERDGTHIGLLTGNMFDGAMGKLGHYGLDRYFLWGGFGDHHSHRDDVAKAALAAVPEGVGEIAEIFVVGDTHADIICARAIGAKSIAVGTGNYSLASLAAEKPDYLWDNLHHNEVRSTLGL